MSEMDLKSAVAAAEGLLNFYRPLEKLVEILRHARGAVQLVSERTAQAAVLAMQIADARSELDTVTRATRETLEALDAQKRAREGEIATSEAAARVRAAAIRAAFARETQESEGKARATLDGLNSEITKLSAARDALTVEQSSLRAVVEELRAKLKGL